MCHKLREEEYEPEPAVGTVVPLVRVPEGGHVEVHTYPLRSVGEVAATIVGFSLLVFLVLWLAFAASPARDRWQECRRARRRQQRGHLDRHDRVMRNHPV